MSYSGTGANRTPLGRINPILLGRKRPEKDAEPSLLTQHLRQREQKQQTGREFDSYDQFGQPFDQGTPQQFEQRPSQGFDQRPSGPPFTQGPPQQYDQRGGNQHFPRGGQQFDHRSTQAFEQRGSQQFDPRGGQQFDQRGSQQYDQRGGASGQPFDERAGARFDPRSNQQYDQRGNQQFLNRGTNLYDHSLTSGPGFDHRSPGVPGSTVPSMLPGQQFEQPPLGYPPYDSAQQSQGQRGQTVPMRLSPQPLMSANVPPPSQGMPPLPPVPMAATQKARPPEMIGGTSGGNFPPPLPLLPSGPETPVKPPPPPQGQFSQETDGVQRRDDSPARKKRKRSRWGDEEKKTSIPGMPATMPKNMTEEQTKQYLMHFKIEEISMRLRTGDLGIPDNPEDRSPSPEPIYNSEGKRLNTREFRVRKNLEEERHNLIQDAIKANPNFKPPADYKPPSTRIQEKVMIPQDANPAINFIGLLIGPRGNTLKKMEKETNCKIIIRGKGSVKEGKGRAGMPLPGEDEPLHALVTGPTHEDVKKAVEVISKIIKEGIETPEGSNELRKMQLRELAALNGTLIEEDMVRCRNCGSNEHRHWECTEQKNVTHAVVCTKCGGYGHIATDCVVTDTESVVKTPSISERAKMDDEYMSLMAELGVDAPPQGQAQGISSGNTGSSKEFSAISQPTVPTGGQSDGSWGGAEQQNNSWSIDKKDTPQSSQGIPPPLMSQNTVTYGNKVSGWVPGTSSAQNTPQGSSAQLGTGQPGPPQPLMSVSGQPPVGPPPVTGPQGIPPLMGHQAAYPPLMGSGSPIVPGMTHTAPAGAPPPPGVGTLPPPPPSSSSSAPPPSSTPATQAPLPPWQTPGLPPWQTTPMPPQDPMAAFMPMMYPPVAPPVGVPPASALHPWMTAPPPPPPPPSS